MINRIGMRKMLFLLVAFFLCVQGAAATESKKPAKQGGKYKQISGEVVSITQDSIVIKSKTKGAMTFAITKNTDMIGPEVKSGDKAKVNYRVDQNGNTATRISAKATTAKAKKKQTAAALPADPVKTP